MQIDTFLDCAQCGTGITVESFKQRNIECPNCHLKLISSGTYDETRNEWNRKQIEIAEKRLKPCRYCGGKGRINFGNSNSGWNEVHHSVSVSCAQCGMSTKWHDIGRSAVNNAVKDWNR
ncbi:MAG: Lar family restriction alleviation protein [Flexilinea sp.]|nr:Lar family restriction alleviation protein [Flexilinea sp.]